ncbi:hypothetical protein B0H14DRAFT_3490173 [Mycena olivaceomarginata]|nr:hypothetical protein B0H14DRAFT_3490173 [Mycena olivaceomarginata]
MPPNRKCPSPLAAHSAAVPYRPPTLVRHRFGHRAPGLPHATHLHLPLGVTQADADSDAQAWAALPTGNNGGWAPGSEWGTGGGWGSGSGWGSSTTTTFGGWGLGSGWGDDAGGWGSGTATFITRLFFRVLYIFLLVIFLLVPGDINLLLAIFTSLNVGTDLHTPTTTAWLVFASIPEATMVLFATGPFVAVTAGASYLAADNADLAFC